MNNWSSRIPNVYWAYVALSIWAALYLMLLHKTSYGIDEGAAQALLLVWSLADNVVSPVVTLGFPDFRTVFLAPVGILWTGNIVAAKATTMLVMATAAWALHAWRYRGGDDEGALIATGLLLISPIVLEQIDTISVSAYLLLTFALGTWANLRHRESRQYFGGLYFAQIFLCLVSITLHPMGLAYPLALIWSWYKNPVDQNHRNYMFGGIAFVILMAFVLTSGWRHIEWFTNPIIGLSSIIMESIEVETIGVFNWISGIGILITLFLVIWKQARNISSDFLGCTLLLALLIGVLVGDEILGIVALVVCLYWGLPSLLGKPTKSQSGFWEQRGMVLLLAVVVSITFMQIDKAHYRSVQAGTLVPRDTLIKLLAEDSGLFLNDETAQDSTARKPIRVASQWPGLTMLACRCDALSLPPEAQNSDSLLAMLKGIDYLIFDPRKPINASLSRNLASMDSGKVETVALQKGGVIVLIKRPPSSILIEKQK